MRLIDSDALTEELYDLKYTKECPSIILTPTGQEIYNSGVETAIGTVLDAPIVDAVPVIRCKDCKHRGGYRCPMYHTETSLDDLDGFDDYNVDKTDGDGFCHRGEKKG